MEDPTRSRPPIRGDAFGRMLLSCLDSDEPVTEVIERDDGHIGTGDARRYFGTPDGWSAVTRWAIERAQGRVLDVGAGAGQHALELQSRGLDVTGLDISPGAVEVLSRRGLRSTFLGSVHQLARRRPGRFDCALFMGHNLGLFANPKEAVRLANSVDRVLAPGGTIVGTALNAYDTEEPDHLAYHAWNRSRGRPGGQMRIRVRFHALASPWFDYLMLPVEDFAKLLEESPWRVADVFHERPHHALELRRR